MIKNCENCVNGIEDIQNDLIWCKRYDCLTEQVIKETENPSCWENKQEYNKRRFKVCWECKNFKFEYPKTENKIHSCKKGLETPLKKEKCKLFKYIDNTTNS